MEARVNIFGHSIHQMLIVFPLGLFCTAVIFDVIHLVSGGATWSVVSYWMIAAGIIGGLCAAVFGAADWTGDSARHPCAQDRTAARTRKRVRRRLFAVSWFLRRGDRRTRRLPRSASFSSAWHSAS